MLTSAADPLTSECIAKLAVLTVQLGVCLETRDDVSVQECWRRGKYVCSKQSGPPAAIGTLLLIMRGQLLTDARRAQVCWLEALDLGTGVSGSDG